MSAYKESVCPCRSEKEKKKSKVSPRKSGGLLEALDNGKSLKNASA